MGAPEKEDVRPGEALRDDEYVPLELRLDQALSPEEREMRVKAWLRASEMKVPLLPFSAWPCKVQ